MRIRGGGDPMRNHGSRAAVQIGPAAPELAADANDCIMVRSSNDRPNTRLWRAISATPMASSPRIFIAGCNWPCHTQRQTKSTLRCRDQRGADLRTSDAKSVAPSRRIMPSCSRPSRTLRAADAVAPKMGPSLTAAARDGSRNERPGRKNGSAGAEQKNWRRKR